ncbi:MAG: CopD family protein [Chloroflexota bacterium]
MKRFRYILPFLLLCLLCTNILPTQAHGYIVRSIPENRSTLERPPTRLQYWFSEALEPEFSEINLRNDRGEILASGSVDPADDSLLTLRVPQDLVDGAYIVELRPAFASDGHVVAESQVFFVGEEVEGVVGVAASDQAIPMEVVWKALLINTTYLLFGTSMLYVYVLVPVWGNTRYPQGLLPPRVMTYLNGIMIFGISFAILANVIAILQQSMVFFGTTLDQVIEGNLWQVVRIGSRFGDVWNFRMLLLLIVAGMLGASIYYRAKYPKFVRSFWTANTYILALLIGAQAVNSHAAGSLVMPWNAVMMHWLHAIAVAFWVGGILALTLILPIALQPYDETTRWEALRPVMQRFSRYVMGAVAIVITSGIYSASNWFFAPNDFLTTYGAALGYKSLMVALLLIVGGLHHVALRPHLQKYIPFAGAVNWARKFTGSMQLEAVFVLITLISASVLSATPIPEPDFLSDESTVRSYENRRVDDYEVQLTLSPAGTGINSLDLSVRRNILLIDDVTVDVQFVLPYADARSAWLSTENVAQGVFTVVTDMIDQAGEWLILVDIIDVNGQLTRIVYNWQISEDSGITTSIPANWVNILSALATTGAVIYVLYPALRKLSDQMEWTATNITISVGVILMTAVILVASTLFLNYQAQQLSQEENPPPQIINTVQPDMGSIALGGGLIRSDCPTWTEDNIVLLSALLDTLRDDELFGITQDGWRDLDACSDALTTTQRWHIVNYLRTLRR